MTRDLTLQPSVSAEAIAADKLKIEVKLKSRNFLKIESFGQIKTTSNNLDLKIKKK